MRVLYLLKVKFLAVRVRSVVVAFPRHRCIKNAKNNEHTTASIRWSSPTQLLISRFEACQWQSGRDAEYSSIYGRM